MSDNADPNQNSSGTPNPGNTNDLPQWARDAISKGNNEAARFRTELRSVTDQNTAAMEQITALAGEKDAAAARAAAVEKELLKLRVAVQTGVPGEKAADFAALLQGDDEASLKAHAETVKGLLGTSGAPAATDPSQGRGDDADATTATPETAFAAVLRSQLDSLNR